MILSQPNRSEATCSASSPRPANLPRANISAGKAAMHLFKLLMAALTLSAAATAPLCAATLFLPNASFESPVVPPARPMRVQIWITGRNHHSRAGMSRLIISTLRGRTSWAHSTTSPSPAASLTTATARRPLSCSLARRRDLPGLRLDLRDQHHPQSRLQRQVQRQQRLQLHPRRHRRGAAA